MFSSLFAAAEVASKAAPEGSHFWAWFWFWVVVVVIVDIVYLANCFTFGKEGTGKIVLRWGGYLKTLLVKNGYKLDNKNNIVELLRGELPNYPKWMGGLRFVSFLKPLGIDKFLSRDMKFQKAGVSGMEDRDVKNVQEFLAAVDYPYAVEFLECYDTNNISINGHATMIGRVDNLYKSMCQTTDFYAKVIGDVLPAVRECLKVNYSFTVKSGEDAKKTQDLDTLLWEYLSDPQKNPQPGSGLSVKDELYKKYAFVLVSFRVSLIKIPEVVSEKATKKWQAQMDAEAATEQAKASAALFDDTNQALKAWIDSQRAAGYEPTQALIVAKQKELHERALAKTDAYQQSHIKGLENATTVAIGGGGGGGVLFGVGGKGQKQGDKPNKKGGKEKDPKNMSGKELEEAWEEEFDDKLE